MEIQKPFLEKVFGRRRQMSCLKDEINGIAEGCSDCGNCLFACPVYNAELVEPNSPRGKINLIKSLMDGRLQPGSLNREFIYRCALCGSCEYNCTKNVRFVDLMIDYRNEASKGKKIPILKKIILFLYQSVLFRKMPFIIDLLAKTPLQRKLGVPRRRKANIKKLYHKPKGDHKEEETDILFFPGCVLTLFYPQIIEKAVNLMKSKGFSVVIPQGLQCCGFPFISQGWKDKFLGLREKNKTIFSRYRFKYLVAPCGTGVMTFKNYYGFEEGSVEIHELTEFFFKYMKETPVDSSRFTGKITWHDPCHHLKSLGIADPPRFFMKQLGDKFVDDKSELCCGFGGIFSVGFPSTSKKILQRKVNRLNELKADTVVTACPGCYLQLRERSLSGKEVKFFTDLFG